MEQVVALTVDAAVLRDGSIIRDGSETSAGIVQRVVLESGVVYASERADITDKVLERLKQQP